MELMGAEPLRTGLTATLFIVGIVALSLALRHFKRTTADDQTRCDAGADVSRHPVWRIAVSRLHQRGSVPVTADVRVGFGMDAFHSGLLVLAVFVGNLTIKPATTPLIRSFGV